MNLITIKFILFISITTILLSGCLRPKPIDTIERPNTTIINSSFELDISNLQNCPVMNLISEKVEGKNKKYVKSITYKNLENVGQKAYPEYGQYLDGTKHTVKACKNGKKILLELKKYKFDSMRKFKLK